MSTPGFRAMYAISVTGGAIAGIWWYLIASSDVLCVVVVDVDVEEKGCGDDRMKWG